MRRLLFFLLFTLTSSVFATNYSTKSTGGSYTSASTWVNGLKPPATPAATDSVFINGNVTGFNMSTITCYLEIKAGSSLASVVNVTVNGGKVMVKGTFTFGNTYSLTIISNYWVIIAPTGSILMGKRVTVYGYLDVFGNLDLPNDLLVIWCPGIVTVENGSTVNIWNSHDILLYGRMIVHGTVYVDHDLVIQSDCNPDGRIDILLVWPAQEGGYVHSGHDVQNEGLVYISGGMICWDHAWTNNVAQPAGMIPANNCYANLGPLGITLTSFTATAEGRRVALKWITENEENNDHFIIERSNNLSDWVIVGTKQGSLLSSGQISYLLYDETTAPGVNYYRLSQMDRNGTLTIYDKEWLRYVFIKQDNYYPIFPDPCSASITMVNQQFDLLGYTITDITGRPLIRGTLNPGKNEIPLLSVTPGVYLLNTLDGNTYRFVKEK